MVYANKLPACLVKQVTKEGDGTFVAVVQSHHLRCGKLSVTNSSKVDFTLLTAMSKWYTIESARPKLGSRGFGGTGSSAPGISCVAGSSQASVINWSTITSCVLGLAAIRKCFSIGRQYSSAQSWSTLHRRKIATSSCCTGCGSKKLCP